MEGDVGLAPTNIWFAIRHLDDFGLSPIGADDRVRTDDNFVGNEMLYQLSYIRRNKSDRTWD